MPKKICARHGRQHPCTCGMGNLYRFIEPVVLLLLRQNPRSCGYTLCAELQDHALTDNEIDKAALYRALRQLEKNGKVTSSWETGEGGPARRVYRLTKAGEAHLREWSEVLDNLSRSMARFVRQANKQPSRLLRKTAA
jgi:PadR family transcriptional regulator PadR